MRQYKEKCNEAARKVASNVLEWLTEQHPDRQFDAYFTSASLPDGPSFYNSNICQTGPGLWRKILPKRIASITDFGHVEEYARQSYDESTLPQERLDMLMDGIDIQNIRDIWKKEIPPRPESRITRFLEEAYEKTRPHAKR